MKGIRKKSKEVQFEKRNVSWYSFVHPDMIGPNGIFSIKHSILRFGYDSQ